MGDVVVREVGGAAPRSGREPRRWWPSGGVGDGEGVAEGLELADEVSGLAVGIDATGVVVGAEVDGAGVGVVERPAG